MLLTPEQRLEELVVRELAQRPQLTATELKVRLSKECSLKALYKALNKLEDGGVIVRTKGSASLALQWILAMGSLTERMTSTYLSNPTALSVMPETGAKHTWSFTSLAQANMFWTQVIALLAHRSNTKVLFDWVPHPWFCLLQPKIERQFLSGIKSMDCRVFRIVGGNSYLYTLWKDYWAQMPGQTAFAPGPFDELRSKYLVVADNYVLTVQIDSKTTERLEALYELTTAPELVDIAETTGILYGSAKLKMTLQESSKRARPLSKKFCRYFGIPLPE